MKKLFTLFTTALISYSSYSCSCMPWNVNFFDNIRPNSTVGLFRLDSTWVEIDTSTMNSVPMAQFTVLKSYSLDTLKAGDVTTFFGQDGVNCAVGFNEWNLGDTIMASIVVNNPFFLNPYELHCVPFQSPTGCGRHYITIKNKMGDGKSLDELEDELVNQYLSGVQNHAISEVSIYPNPVQDVLIIEGLNDLGVRMNIYTITGERILTDMTSTSGKLDVSSLKPGVYFLEIVQGDSRLSRRIVKK